MLLTVVSDRIARAFNRSGASRAVARDIQVLGMPLFFRNLHLIEYEVRYLLLFSVIDSFR